MNTFLLVIFLICVVGIFVKVCFNPIFQVVEYEDKKIYFLWYTIESGYRSYIKFTINKDK